MTVVASTAPPLSGKMNFQLSLMMFLQYGIWGAWLPILFPYMGYLGFKPGESVAIFFVGAVGAIIGPFLAGQVADRYFNTERFLAASHIIGGIMVWFLSSVHSFGAFLVFSLVYGLIYAPTLALTNSLTFHHVPDRDRDFGRIRVWGTIGWIVVGIAVGQWLDIAHTPRTPEAIAAATTKYNLAAGTAKEAVVATAQNAGRSDAFKFSAILGILMGLYCLALPKTPPSKAGAGTDTSIKKNATFEALGEIKLQPLITLFLLAVPISMIHQFYFVHTAGFLSDLQIRQEAAQSAAVWINKFLGVGGGGLMTIGQMMEIVVLAVIPFFAKSLSRKTLLSIGIVAYGLRMALFAYTTSIVPILFGVALHGFCFGCFIFVAFMVVDENTSKDVRASAQNLFNLVVMGLGITVGSWFAIYVVGQWAVVDGKTDFTKLFSVPMWMSLACLVLLQLFYRGGKKVEQAA